MQALIELAEAGSDERALLESIQNHLRPGAGVGGQTKPQSRQGTLW